MLLASSLRQRAGREVRVASVHLGSVAVGISDYGCQGDGHPVAVVGWLYMTSMIGKRASRSRQAAAKSAVPTSPVKSE
jgi:hypothetical protein